MTQSLELENWTVFNCLSELPVAGVRLVLAGAHHGPHCLDLCDERDLHHHTLRTLDLFLK